ncbi:MAG: heme exporter protein B [Arenicella sp.]|jgi:heme exporter protein B
MNQLFGEVKALLAKEFLLEWRQRYALSGLLLYVISTVFICYLSFNLKRGAINPITWNTLFWIILLFTSVNGIAKGFTQERAGRFYFYYTLASPESIIISKIIYHAVLMLGVSLTALLVYVFVMGNPVQDWELFLATVLLGAIGFSTTLTMISAIASKAQNSGTLMAVLGFPVILPMLLMLMKVSKNALDGLARSASTEELLTILAINLIVVSISYLLFPYLWRS